MERKFSPISQIKEKDQERFDAWLSCAGVMYWNLRDIEGSFLQFDVQRMINGKVNAQPTSRHGQIQKCFLICEICEICENLRSNHRANNSRATSQET